MITIRIINFDSLRRTSPQLGGQDNFFYESVYLNFKNKGGK